MRCDASYCPLHLENHACGACPTLWELAQKYQTGVFEGVVSAPQVPLAKTSGSKGAVKREGKDDSLDKPEMGSSGSGVS